MYTSPCAAALSLRAKWSLYHLPGDEYLAAYVARYPLYAVPRNPSFLYRGYVLRRSSVFLRLDPPPTTRTVRVCDVAAGDELLGLLAERRRRRHCCGCCKGESTRFSRKEGSWEGDSADSDETEGSWGLDVRRGSRKAGDCGGRRAERRKVAAETARGRRRKVGEVREVEDEEEELYRGAGNGRVGRRRRDDREESVGLWRDSERGVREEEDEYEELEGSRMQVQYRGRSGNAGASSSRREARDRGSKVEDENFGDQREEHRHDVRKRQSEVDKRVVMQADSRKSSLQNRNAERRLEEERVVKGREERSASVKDFVQVRRDERARMDQHAVDKVAPASDSRYHASGVQQSKGYLDIRRDDQIGSSSARRYEEEKLMDQVTVDSRREQRDDQIGSSSARRFEEEKLMDRVTVDSQREQRDDQMKSSSSRDFGEERLIGQGTFERRAQTDLRAVDELEVNEKFETGTSHSRFQGGTTERANRSKRYVDIRRDDEIESSSRRRFEEQKLDERRENHNSIENTVQVRRDERTEVNQQFVSRVELNEQYENQTIGRTNLKSSLQIRGDDRNEHSNSVVNVAHGVSEFRSGMQRGESSSSAVVEDKKDDMLSSSLVEDRVHTNVQAGTGGSIRGGSSTMYQVKNGGIESASRYDRSSAVYMGEFVDKLREESLALESLQVAEADNDRHSEVYIEEIGRQSSSRSGLKGPSDEMWEVRGMSSQEPPKVEEEEQEQEPGKDSPAENFVDSTSSPGVPENAISRRSHRSLWTYIADIMKVGWGHRAGSHTSTKRSRVRSTSNDSISSEAWFSGHEQDENDDETEKEKDTAPNESAFPEMPVEQSPSSVSASTSTRKQESSSENIPPIAEKRWTGEEKRKQGIISSQMTTDQLPRPEITISPPTIEAQDALVHRSNLLKSEEEFDRVKQPARNAAGMSHMELKKWDERLTKSMPIGRSNEEYGMDPSTSIKSRTGASSFKGVTLASDAEEFVLSENERGQTGSIYRVEQPPVSTSRMSPPSIPEVENLQMASSGVTGVQEFRGVTDGDKVLEGGGTEGELKRRKLQRNKQVMKEQFEEWEEAYQRDSEQRKIDEFFMREALLEAKKAADTWEVPVGAVLVHNGKIIARGCNLVEELRDSTAHAEMICIREASKLLRSWRLAETTLYVTLEPCAMCAGAILQARIDTVVWGAPNKLLGADGSWVRLFPGGDGESSSLDPSSQTTGLVHPFHPKITIRRGVLANECADAMQQFFQLRRRKKKKEEQPSPPSCLPISTQPTKFFTRIHNIFSVMFCL